MWEKFRGFCPLKCNEMHSKDSTNYSFERDGIGKSIKCNKLVFLYSFFIGLSKYARSLNYSGLVTMQIDKYSLVAHL